MFRVAESGSADYSSSNMRRRHHQFWLVMLNLLAFNAYALNAVAALVPHRIVSQMAQVETTEHGDDHAMAHKGCHEAQGTPAIHQSTADHCDMPCCKGIDKSTSTLSDHCACKLGSSTLQLYGVMAIYNDIVIDSFKVDAMSTTFVPQDRTQRLLRPPIF